MSGISINLLPSQFQIDQKAQKKFNTIQRISIFCLLTLIFLVSVSASLRIFQTQKNLLVQKDIEKSQERVLSLKEKEASIFVLKNRLNLIQTVLSTGGNALIYKSVLDLFPENVSITSVSVDRSGIVSLVLAAPDLPSLNATFANLTSGESFNFISKIDVENLSRSRDGSFRTTLKITTEKL